MVIFLTVLYIVCLDTAFLQFKSIFMKTCDLRLIFRLIHDNRMQIREIAYCSNGLCWHVNAHLAQDNVIIRRHAVAARRKNEKTTVSCMDTFFINSVIKNLRLIMITVNDTKYQGKHLLLVQPYSFVCAAKFNTSLCFIQRDACL